MKVMINWDRERGLGSVIFKPVVVPFKEFFLDVKRRQQVWGGRQISIKWSIQFLNNFKNRMEINNLKIIALFVKQ